MRLKVFNFKNIKSTNDRAIKIIKNSNINYGMVITENQKNGRGRYGKKWISYKGNLCASIFFEIDKSQLSIKQLTDLNCRIVRKILKTYCNKKISIKSPNDLLIDGKKISGILQEKINKFNKTFIIVGIGINLVKNPNIIDYPTTNLFTLTKVKFKKKEIEKKLKLNYEKIIPKIKKSGRYYNYK